jgi:hypothetical protein
MITLCEGNILPVIPLTALPIIFKELLSVRVFPQLNIDHEKMLPRRHWHQRSYILKTLRTGE